MQTILKLMQLRIHGKSSGSLARTSEKCQRVCPWTDTFAPALQTDYTLMTTSELHHRGAETFLKLHSLPVLARRCARVFAKDVAKVGGRGEVARGGDIFEFAVRGA